MCGYAGPIYMTHPTKAICPILLVRTVYSPVWQPVTTLSECLVGGLSEDYGGEKRRTELLHISDDQRLHEESRDHQPPSDCEGGVSCGSQSKSMTAAEQVDADLEIKAYYAGHVLGAAMVQVKVHHQSIVYTVSIVLPWQQLIAVCSVGRL